MAAAVSSWERERKKKQACENELILFRHWAPEARLSMNVNKDHRNQNTRIKKETVGHYLTEDIEYKVHDCIGRILWRPAIFPCVITFALFSEILFLLPALMEK